MPSAWHTLGRGAMSVRRGFAAETIAYLEYLDSQGVGASETRAVLLDGFIGGSAADGNLAKLDVLYTLSGHDDLATRVNIKAPGSNTMTKINSPLFTADVGWNDNGGAGYLDTGFNAATAGGAFSQNDASLVASVLNDGTSSAGVVGAGTNVRIVPRATTNLIGRINRSSNSTFALPVATAIGTSALDRTSSSNMNGYKNGALIAGAGGTTLALESFNILALTFSGIAFTGRTVGMIAAGRSLGAAGHAALHARWVTFATALGLTPE